MMLILKSLRILFYISLTAWIITSLYTAPLPEASQVSQTIKSTEPIQTEIKADIIKQSYEKVDYHISPSYEYEIVGLVVTQHNTKSFTDLSHEFDPGNTKDICIVWGENITNGSYKEVRYYSGDFTCFVQWDRELDDPFKLNKIANNHILPASSEIAKQINGVKIGDQIRLKGKLADYKVIDKAGQEIFTRPTSTTRDDTGNGACEVLYVEEVEVLLPGNPVYYGIKAGSTWTTLGLASFFTGKFLLGR
jgi:hypothetical protein